MDLEQKSLKELVSIYNSLRPTVRIKRFASRSSAIARINRLQNGPKKKTVRPRVKAQGTKVSIIREMFSIKDTWTREELAKRSGFDRNNISVALSILKNPKRTKDLLITKYNPGTRAYTLVAGH
jgi:hypothetical protein